MIVHGVDPQNLNIVAPLVTVIKIVATTLIIIIAAVHAAATPLALG